MCLLDATYKTTRYALPLFFLFVRTNVHYIVVATFLTQNEDSASIAEALDIHPLVKSRVDSDLVHGGLL